MSRRVLVTGAYGFTGRYILPALLARGDDVLALQDRPVEESRHGVRCFVADLADPGDAMRQAVEQFAPTHVLHLAALSHVTASASLDYYRVNVLGTEKLLQAVVAGAPSVARVVLASSANVYGNARVSPIEESTIPAPVNHYAASKLAMEHIARTFTDRLPIVVARPFNYTGCGQPESFLVPKIVGHYARREPRIRLGNLEVARDFSDVRFVAQVYLDLLDRAPPGLIVNICSGRATSLMELLDSLERISGWRLAVEQDPALMRASEIRELCGSDRRLRETLGEIRAPTFEETLRWMWEGAVGAAQLA